MKMINRVLLTAILGIWALFSTPIARSEFAAHIQTPHSTKQSKPPTPPTTPIPGGTTSVRVRGNNFCSIAPASLGQTSTPTIWHDLPMFIWDGRVSRIEIRPHNSETVLWMAEPAPDALSVQYDGVPLEPGQTYDAIITTDGKLILSFTVMDTQTRDRIAAELRELEAQLQEQGADAQSIAFARAQHFAKLGLRSDALQEAFLAIEPGEDAIAIAALLTCDLGN